MMEGGQGSFVTRYTCHCSRPGLTCAIVFHTVDPADLLPDPIPNACKFKTLQGVESVPKTKSAVQALLGLTQALVKKVESILKQK